jgi:recombinational DNA repair protein RecT
LQEQVQRNARQKSSSFMTSVLQIAAQNQLLATADPVSIYQAAAGRSNPGPSVKPKPRLCVHRSLQSKLQGRPGQMAKEAGAQFQMGYKGIYPACPKERSIQKHLRFTDL